jgi:hypothetical protein
LAVRCRVEREGVESGRGMGILGRERLWGSGMYFHFYFVCFDIWYLNFICLFLCFWQIIQFLFEKKNVIKNRFIIEKCPTMFGFKVPITINCFCNSLKPDTQTKRQTTYQSLFF